MTKRYLKPGGNKHGITDKKLCDMLVRFEMGEKKLNRSRCISCGKIIFCSLPEAHIAAKMYNIRYLLTNAPNKKKAYECKTSPGCFHFGAAMPDGAVAILGSKGKDESVFIPPVMPHKPVVPHVPMQKECRIIIEAPKDMDEINLNGYIYIKKHLVPKPPAIIGSIFLNGVSYKIIK